mmetsp:Transcript_34327/g.78312  ORF Transcript_34327/g.78312 Transcript_34327/m.78312 type:complete len:312 (+) Transcript_34327:371-1306(+)
MLQGLACGDPVLGVEHEDALQQVREVCYTLALLVTLSPCVVQCCGNALGRLKVGHFLDDVIFGHRVNGLVAERAEVVLEVLGSELASAEHLLAERAFVVHPKFDHLVVGFPWEHVLSGVELEKTAANAPDVHRIVIRDADGDLRRTVPATLHVRSNFTLVSPISGSKVADSNLIQVLCHDHVVQLDVTMHNLAVSEMLESRKQLFGVGPHGLNAEPDSPPILLEQFSRVHVQSLEHHAEVVLVLEMGKQPDTTTSVFRVFESDLLEQFDFFLSGVIHCVGRIFPNNLDRNSLVKFLILAPQNSAEHSFANQ